MARRILSCKRKCSPDQPPAPKEEPDTQTASTTYQMPFSPIAGLTCRPSQSPPPANSVSIKRERSGQPVAHARSRSFRGSQSSLYGYSSEDNLDSRSSTSGSDSDDISCSDSEHSSTGAAQEYVSSRDHRFQSSMPELLKSSLDSLDAWMKSARYVLAPDDSLPPRKRLRTSHWKEGDDGIDRFIAVSSPVRYYHLACPFYVCSPARYQQCLLQYDLRSIEDVIRHLRRHHMKPPYCPLCSQTFDSLSSRDSHILERTCELRDPQPIQGINFYQESKLKRPDKIYLSEAKRWQHIYATVFPNSDPPHSPYLDRGHGKVASMARDYWREYGRLCICQFLERGELLGEEERDRTVEDALYKLALDDMLRAIARRYGYQWEGFNNQHATDK